MNDVDFWWQEESPKFLEEALPFINSSRSTNEPIGRCDDLCKALNKTWNAYLHRRTRRNHLNTEETENGSSDSQSLRELLVSGLTDEQQGIFSHSDSIRSLAEFSPHIMNQHTLLNEHYAPSSITERVHKKATKEHRQLLSAWQCYCVTTDDIELRKSLLRKIATLLYVVRSNIAHSEKTPKGPDLAKAERDRLVCRRTSPVIEELFDILFGRPSKRLAVYGTLAPGQPNSSQLDTLEGQWSEGVVEGEIEQRNGLPQFRWILGKTHKPIQLLTSAQLSEEFARLDHFEGLHYRRILVPVNVDGQMVVTNIYEANVQD